jgi:hypothetical protein
VNPHKLDETKSFSSPDFVQPSLPEFFQRYVSFDIEGLARDLELSGDIMTSKGVQGVHIFYSRW